MSTVTVTRGRKKSGNYTYKLTFSALPGKMFGPWDFAETVRDLTVSAMLSPMAARNLVLDACAHVSASTEINR